MLQILKYNSTKLEEYVNSDEFNSLENIPISTHRALSYFKNPRLDQKDNLLFIGVKDGNIVGYRTVLPDFLVKGNEKIKFAWFSGNWVHPKYRRQGISSQLLKEVITDWESNLLYTNYAPASKAVYDKSNLFKEIHQKEGYRIYFKSCIAILLAPKSDIFKKMSFLLHIIDWILNIFLSIYYSFFNSRLLKTELRAIQTDKIDPDTIEFLNLYNKTLTQRSKSEFDWIINYPWIKQEKDSDPLNMKYHFSTTAKSFSTQYYKIFNDNNEIIAFLIFKERNRVLDIPYLFLMQGFESDILKIIINLCFNHKTKFITFYHEYLVKVLKSNSMKFFIKRKLSRKYFASDKLHRLIEGVENINFQDGDGDCVFT